MKIIKIEVEEEKYPQRLLQIKSFPTEIYAVGNIELLNANYTIGIVGSRKCTEYGRKVTNEFAKELSEKEICVISGMAIGIDGEAHNAAIKKEGKTIAVLGGGFNYIYPSENEWLFHKILREGGCIISEYPPDRQPDKSNFPNRNRIISGLSDAILIVEATYRSGSSITAKYAKKEGKPVFAIPNTIYSNTGIGTNRLIQEGATLVTNPMQIIEKIKPNESIVGLKSKEMHKDDIKIEKKNKEKSMSTTVKSIKEVMSKEFLEIYKLLSEEPIHINEIARISHKPIQEINPVITMLELEGYAYQPQINYFIKNVECC